MPGKKINIAIVGLGFGAEFIPIYQRHPNANLYAICQRNATKLKEVGDAFGVEKRYTDYDELLKDPAIDAVHINTPIPDHAAQSIKALKAGKHVACTVPMATSVEDCRQIVELVKSTGLTYMMMETVVYAREFLFMKELYDKGELGKIQFLKASHQQDMDGWPNYWPGLPPMHYATHCVGPVLALTRGEAEYVSCFGSGTIREELQAYYNSPFAVESTHIKFRNADLSAHIYRSLFDTARQYRESFEVCGSHKSVEWPLDRGKTTRTAYWPNVRSRKYRKKYQSPDYAHLLPEPITAFYHGGGGGGVYDEDDHQHLSFTQGAGHGGSHPHLVHEFVSALVDKRSPYPNAVQSANITCVGILAHESALQGGKQVYLPDFTFEQ